MDYDDNDFQGQNLHLAGEGNNKFPPVLRPYALPRFDFDDNLHGHLRFDSLVETEVFLGIESSEDNQWIEDFSRGSTGIAFSSSAAEPCSISRGNNVWSEAASSESVEMLLKSVGQDETIPGQIISKDSDACDELGCIIKQMEPSLKHGDSSLSKVGDDLQPALLTSEVPGKFSGLKDDVGGDHLLVEGVSHTQETEQSVDGAPNDPNTISRNSDSPVIEKNESNDGEKVVINEHQVDALVDQSLDNRGNDVKFASGSQVDTLIPSEQNTCISSALIDSQDTTHLKNDIIDENMDSLERGIVGSGQEVHLDSGNSIEDAVASVTLPAQRHSTSEMQSKEDGGHAIQNMETNVGESFDRITEGNTDHHVEECSEGLGAEILQTGKSEDIVMSEGKLDDIPPMPYVGNPTIKEHESEVSNTDSRTCTSLESKVDSVVQVTCDATEKDFLESDCHPDKEILSSKSEKSLFSAEDGKGFMPEGEGAPDALGAETTTVSEEYIVPEDNNDCKCDESVPAAGKQPPILPSDCSNADGGDNGSPLVIKGVDSSSLSTGSTVDEFASNLQSDVAGSKSGDSDLLPSGKDLPADAVFNQKEVKVSSPEASLSTMKTTFGTTPTGGPCETAEQLSCKKVDQSLTIENSSNAEDQSADQIPHVVTVDRVKDMQPSSVVSDLTVKEIDGAEAQIISERGPSEVAGAVSAQQMDETQMNPVPSVSKEPSHNNGQNRPEDSEIKSVSQEKASGHVAVHHVDDDGIPPLPSQESQTKFNVIESGSNSAGLDNPSCGSPIVIGTSEQSLGNSEKEGVQGSSDQNVSVSGVINGETNKEQSLSQDTKGNNESPGDKSFTFEVPPFADMSEKEAGKNWQPFSTIQLDKVSSVMEGTPSTSGLSKVTSKTAQDVSPTPLQAPEKEKVRGGSKGASERRPRRASRKSLGKEAARKGVSKETTPARQSERSDRPSNVSLSSAGIGQLVQPNEMQPYGHAEGGNIKPFGVLSTSVSSLPDLNTSASSSAAFHQPFTDLQQVQLRAQIFVYGALIQGTAPDEAYMISAFGGPDGGRTIWENALRACVERQHGHKSHIVSPETPLQSRAKASDQPIKQSALQSKVTSSPASRSTSKSTPTTIVNPMIPLSSPLWSIPTPSGDALQPTGIPRGAVVDYQQALSPLHPPPIRNFVGANAPWMSQSPFRAPWVPQTSAFDGNARFPVLPITETVNLTPVREASMPHSSGMKQVSPVPMVQSGSPATVFAGTPLLDTKKATVTSVQHSADPKPRKRKKSTISEDPGQIVLHSQKELLSTAVATGHAFPSAAITTPATVVSKSSIDKPMTSASADTIKKGDQDSDQKATLSEETLSKLKEAQKQAEDAAALASAAVSHGQEIWNQMEKHKNSGLALDVETKLTSAAVAIAAATAVAKAAAAAANVASNAAMQAKLMADEALVSSGYRDPTNAMSSSDSVKKLGKATPASILRGEDATASSNSVIVAAREAARRRVEAASAASKRAENMDAIVKAAELAAEAVSQAGKIVAMGEPFPLNQLVEAGPEAYWKLSQASPEPDGSIREHTDKGGSVEAPGSSARHPKEGPLDKREKQSLNDGLSPTLREMARESMQDHSRLIDGIMDPAATSGKDKKGQKGRKASGITKTKGVTSESEIGFGSPSTATENEHVKAGETSKDNNLREGSHVEVLRDGGDLKVAWFLADILNLKDGKAYVCYKELRSEEDGDRLKEWVELEGEGDGAPRIRSARAITAMPFEGTRKRRRAAMGDYNWSIGDRVDAWMQDSWWEGVVTEKSKKDENSFTIHFPVQGETSDVKAWLLRNSLVWKNGCWVEWSSSGDHGSSHEGDTPQEKRLRLGSPAAEAKGKDKLSKSVDIKESGKPDDVRLLDLTASERIFNIGKSTRDESKPESLRMIRTGLQKEGSRVVFGVPKPGKKRKFMEVSKHYDAEQSSKAHETSDSAKFTKYLMPQGSGPRGTKSKIEPKEKRMAVSKPKVLKSGKPPSVSTRSLPQKDNATNTKVSELEDSVASDASNFKDSVSHAENISGKHNMTEFRSFSSSDGGAEGPVLFSSVAVSSDAPSKKTSTSNAKSERFNKMKHGAAAGKMARIEEEKSFNANSTKTSEVVEPRRSNRRIQPTSRLLEGLQSSLIISKIPSVSHDKSQKSQGKSIRGNN